MVEVIQTLDAKRRNTLLLSLVAILVLFIAAAAWLLSPKYNNLFEGMDEQSAAKTIARLEEQGVPFEVLQMRDGNTIKVPQEQVERLKVTMSAELGLPEVQGLELFDNADYSMTDFSQDVTYKRAIQGELARTISNMPGLKSARVHVTFAPKRLFSSQKQPAKASIYVEQVENVALAKAQVEGIKKLVANAIEKLEPQNVAVFNHKGEQIGLTEASSFSNQLDKKYQAKLALEERLVEKAYRLLTLSISAEKIAVSADVVLNFDKRTRTKQGFAANGNGEGAILRQKETSVTREPQDKRLANSDGTVSREKETEFTHGQEREETVFSSGEIVNINVGVAISESLSDDHVSKIKQVLVAGLGIDTFRGDKIAVEVLPVFSPAINQVRANIDSASTPQTSNPQPAQYKQVEMAQNLTGVLGAKWWLLLLLLPLPAALAFKRYHHKQKQRREALLLEVKEWLQTRDEHYAKS